jgi:hypothetical protein
LRCLLTVINSIWARQVDEKSHPRQVNALFAEKAQVHRAVPRVPELPVKGAEFNRTQRTERSLAPA